MLPWLKGLDSDTDSGVMQLMKKGDYLTEFLNHIFALDGSKIKRDGYTFFDSAAITGAGEIKGGHDYWCNLASQKAQRVVVWDGASASKCFFQSGSGGQAWTELTKATAYNTAPSSLKRISFEVFNDDLIMAFTDSTAGGKPPAKWNNMTGAEYEALGGNPPSFKFVRKHQGRLWAAGDPARPDRLHFSTPGNHEEWNGTGDSGAIDIDPGDGDVSGITAIFPSFRGMLFVAKGNAIYKVSGTEPLNYKVEPVTYGLGCISHNSAVAVDMDDIYFASERGFHSLVLTEKFGDFEGAFLSKEVQRQYLELSVLHKPYMQGVWIPSLNSVMWNVSRQGTTMDQFWLYDVRFKGWYKWTGANPSALFRVEDSGTKIKKAYFGSTVGRVSKTQNTGIYHDYTNTAIAQSCTTPFLYPDDDPITVKMFKKLGVFVKMPQNETLTATIRLAGHSTTQSVSFTSAAVSTAKLDVSFTLGTSLLDAGGTLRMTPYTMPFDGTATSVQITFSNAVADSYAAIFGFWIEWEPAGDAQETRA